MRFSIQIRGVVDDVKSVEVRVLLFRVCQQTSNPARIHSCPIRTRPSSCTKSKRPNPLTRVAFGTFSLGSAMLLISEYLVDIELLRLLEIWF